MSYVVRVTSREVLHPVLFAAVRYQTCEVVFYVVNDVICKHVESALDVSYLVVEE